VQICVSLFTLMVGVFVHPDLVIKPGLEQLGAAYLVSAASIGITFSLQATYSDKRATDVGVRVCLAAIALFVLFSPDVISATLASFVVLAVIGYWMLRQRKLQEGEPEVVIAEPAFAPSAATSEVLPSMG
jgi:TRAP-type uncharacterized transport system fused permease subunit